MIKGLRAKKRINSELCIRDEITLYKSVFILLCTTIWRDNKFSGLLLAVVVFSVKPGFLKSSFACQLSTSFWYKCDFAFNEISPYCQLSTFNYERHVAIVVLPARSTQSLSPQTENLLEPFSNCEKFLANLIRKPHLKGIGVKNISEK